MNKNTKVKHSFFFVLFFLLMGMLYKTGGTPNGHQAL